MLAVSAFLSHLFTFVLVYHMNMCGTIDRLYMWYRLYEFGVSLTCLFWCARFQLRHVAANGATLDTSGMARPVLCACVGGCSRGSQFFLSLGEGASGPDSVSYPFSGTCKLSVSIPYKFHSQPAVPVGAMMMERECTFFKDLPPTPTQGKSLFFVDFGDL